MGRSTRLAGALVDDRCHRSQGGRRIPCTRGLRPPKQPAGASPHRALARTTARRRPAGTQSLSSPSARSRHCCRATATRATQRRKHADVVDVLGRISWDTSTFLTDALPGARIEVRKIPPPTGSELAALGPSRRWGQLELADFVPAVLVLDHARPIASGRRRRGLRDRDERRVPRVVVIHRDGRVGLAGADEEVGAINQLARWRRRRRRSRRRRRRRLVDDDCIGGAAGDSPHVVAGRSKRAVGRRVLVVVGGGEVVEAVVCEGLADDPVSSGAAWMGTSSARVAASAA